MIILTKSCVILLGIGAKEQAAELVDLNCLYLPVVVIINSSFNSEFCIYAGLNICLYDREGLHTENSLVALLYYLIFYLV